MAEEEPNTTSTESVPKLTIGQRILTSLPSLERQKPRPGRGRLSGSSTDAIEPDAIEPPEDEASRPTGKASAATARSSTSRASSSTRGAARTADPLPDMSNEELTHAIKRIDDREQRYAILAGPFGAAVGIALTVAAIHTDPAVGHKGHEATSILVAYGAARVVLGGLVVLAAVTRRRSFVAFALLFLGTADSFPFALLFWALGGWMIWRVFKYQKALTARGAGPSRARAGAGSRTPQTPRAAARAGSADARQRVAQRQAEVRDRRARRKQTAPTGPSASKRYTPPKPSRPRPPAPTES